MKKTKLFISLILSILLVFQVAFTVSAGNVGNANDETIAFESAHKYVNNDTNITSSDATLIQKHISGLVTLSDDDLKAADVNGDGRVTASDATNIQKYLADIITEFTNGSVVLLG